MTTPNDAPVRLTEKQTINALLAEMYERDRALAEARELVQELECNIRQWATTPQADTADVLSRARDWLAATAQEENDG